MSPRDPASPVDVPSGTTPEEPTIGRLVADATRDLSALVQSEVQLAKSELVSSAKAGGIGAALFAVAGFIGLMVIVLLSFSVAYFLTMTGLHAAWAFLIVAGFYLLLAVLAVVVGVVLMKRIKPPTRTIATAKEIPSALKGQRSSRG